MAEVEKLAAVHAEVFEDSLNNQLIVDEWPPGEREGTYFNNGSCGVKPRSVTQAVRDGWERLNRNPTLMTFIDSDPRENARSAAAELFKVPADSLMLIQNSTYGLQLILQSFLLNAGDELITTNHEHGCIKAICRYLSDTRGISIKYADMDPLKGSEAFATSVLNLISDKTRLVEFSEIDCYSGWRPDIGRLVRELKLANVPFVVDGAHTPGQGICSPADYPIWVASGHKWLAGPNSTGFLYVSQPYADKLRPLCIGDRLFDESMSLGRRLEWQGTADPVRWLGLEAAIKLQQKLGVAAVGLRQKRLSTYLRDQLSSIRRRGTFRTNSGMDESSGMLTVHWNEDDLSVEDLRTALWNEKRIWTQPDFLSNKPGTGMRISCPVYITEEDIEALVVAIASLLKR